MAGQNDGGGATSWVVALKAAAAVAVGLSMVSAGCASGGSTRAPVAVNARSFGDTATFGIRIQLLDVVEETARAQLAQSAYVVVLGVRPGRDIELISPAGDTAPSQVRAGRLDLSMRRYEEVLTDQEAENARRQLAYDRCVSSAEAQARREAEARRRASEKRDSTGKVISGGGQSDYMPTGDFSRRCQQTRSGREVKPKRMAPREPSERYLVVLTSSVPLTAMEIEERLQTLTITAPDVSLTIEALAAGLYAGLPGTFAGAYANW